jgi:hypothetical protein
MVSRFVPTSFIAICILFLAAVGCGNGMPGQDGGNTPDTVSMPDGGNTPDDGLPPSDVQMPPSDGGSDVQVAPETGACYPINPSCIGTMACTCDFTVGMPDMCNASADMMVTCRSLMTCAAPHGNRCSVHLLPDADVQPFACATFVETGDWCGAGSCGRHPDTVGMMNNIYTLDWTSLSTSSRTVQCSGYECWSNGGLATAMLPQGIEFDHWTFERDCSAIYIASYRAGDDPRVMPGTPRSRVTLNWSGTR